jgi:hypothetical protein
VQYAGKTQLVPISSGMKVAEAMAMLTTIFSVPAQHQTLWFQGRALESDKALDDYNIKNGDVIRLTSGVPVKEVGAKFRAREFIGCLYGCPWVSTLSLQIISNAFAHVTSYGASIAYYGAVPLIVYVAYTRRDIPYSNLKALLKIPFAD